ncbi:MAG: tRNA pseudouridine(38-40) synthase TruA [Flavobacteriaceae bacterium]|nr:tRNA pseudouridine(38-40) synthase TruA [Flavobacteriaceae bacterium]
MRYFMSLAYNGTPFHGWQCQPNAISVQEVLEEALTTVLRTPIKITGAGRTDTGVHAKLMVAHFDADIPQKVYDNLVYLLNQYLKKEIVIHSIQKVKEDAHARFDALIRTYEYHIDVQKNPFSNGLSYIFKDSLDLSKMNEAADLIKTFKDFEAFSKTNTDVKTFFCEISHAEWVKKKGGYVFTITANRFLRNMVRAIVGTLLDVGTNKTSVAEVAEIIKSKQRSNAGFSVPAHGLYLTDIQYPNNIYIN